MATWFDRDGTRYELTDGPRDFPPGPDGERQSVAQAVAVLGELGTHELRALAGWLTRWDRGGSTEGLRVALADALETGRLVLWARVRARPPVSAALDDPGPAATGADGVAPPPPTWIAIEVVDDDGNPLSDLAYELVLPDGSLRAGVLDRDGRARVSGVREGVCEVAFPELAPDEWRAA